MTRPLRRQARCAPQEGKERGLSAVVTGVVKSSAQRAATAQRTESRAVRRLAFIVLRRQRAERALKARAGVPACPQGLPLSKRDGVILRLVYLRASGDSQYDAQQACKRSHVTTLGMHLSEVHWEPKVTEFRHAIWLIMTDRFGYEG